MKKKIKIEIKTWAGTVLFKYSCIDNTILKTVNKAVIQGADLQGADLQGADLRGAYLQGADLRGAYLQGADGEKITIEKATVITGLYVYVVMPIISNDGIEYVKMGCYTRTVKEWDKDFWNNESEFPNDKSTKSQLRVLAYKTAKQWLKINR